MSVIPNSAAGVAIPPYELSCRTRELLLYFVDCSQGHWPLFYLGANIRIAT